MAGGIPAIPALTGVAPLPSPATGVPSGGDLFSNLLTSAPAFSQGFEQMQQIRQQQQELKLKKIQMAAQSLQTIAPAALQNPKNPFAVHAVQKAFADMGLDPNLAVKDGQVNADALTQYSPMFNFFTSNAGFNFPYLPPEMQKVIWGQIAPGQPMPDFGQHTNPKEAPSLLRQITAAQAQGDLPMVASLGAQLSSVPGYEQLGQSIVAEAKTGKLSPKLLSALNNTSSLIGLRGSEQQYIQGPKTQNTESSTAVNQARVPEIQSQTALNQATTGLRKNQAATEALRPEYLKAQIAHLGQEDEHLNAETIKAQQSIKAGGSVLATFRAVAVPYNHAMSMVANAQKALDTANANLQNPLAISDPGIRAMYQAQAQAAQKSLAKANAVLAQVKPAYDTYFKAVTSGSTGTPGQPPGGKRFGNTMLHAYMTKYGMSQQQALHQAMSEGWVFDPTMP